MSAYGAMDPGGPGEGRQGGEGQVRQASRAAAEGVRVKSLWLHGGSPAPSCLGSSCRKGGGVRQRGRCGLDFLETEAPAV